MGRFYASLKETKFLQEDSSEIDSKASSKSVENPVREPRSGISPNPERQTTDDANVKSIENGFSLIELRDDMNEAVSERESVSAAPVATTSSGNIKVEVEDKSSGILRPEVAKEDEIVSIENLKEEIDQLLAPILTNQNEITQRIGLVQEDLLKLVDPDFRNSGTGDGFRSKRSPSPIVNHDVSEAIVEIESQPRKSSDEVDHSLKKLKSCIQLWKL